MTYTEDSFDLPINIFMQMREKQTLVLTLPDNMEDVPVQIMRGSGQKHLVVSLGQEGLLSSSALEKRYAFIWRQNDYLKVALDDILWIEATGSYSVIHLADGQSMLVSFHLAVMGKRLPQTDFMRIHRSHIVNMKHVVSLAGNSLKVGDRLLAIGREYRKNIQERFIFLGVRRENPME